MPKNLKLLAVPLMELHSGASKFGVDLAAIPALLSRFHIIQHTDDEAK